MLSCDGSWPFAMVIFHAFFFAIIMFDMICPPKMQPVALEWHFHCIALSPSCDHQLVFDATKTKKKRFFPFLIFDLFALCMCTDSHAIVWVNTIPKSLLNENGIQDECSCHCLIFHGFSSIASQTHIYHETNVCACDAIFWCVFVSITPMEFDTIPICQCLCSKEAFYTLIEWRHWSNNKNHTYGYKNNTTVCDYENNKDPNKRYTYVWIGRSFSSDFE